MLVSVREPGNATGMGSRLIAPAVMVLALICGAVVFVRRPHGRHLPLSAETRPLPEVSSWTSNRPPRQKMSRARVLVVFLIVAWNVVPFVPVWPGYSGGGDSWKEWISPFLFLNALFWLIAVVLWSTGSHRSRRRRVLIAETPAALLQATIFLMGGWPGAAVLMILRGVDGLLLYALDSRASREREPSSKTTLNEGEFFGR
jgi:hypothetical protein